MNEIQTTLMADIEKYKATIQDKKNKLDEYRNAINQAQAEITLLSGAIQQSEKILKAMSVEGEPVDTAESKVE
jgi:peptidoglycan hydrolase CwlO-like protein